ncbi:3 beta-hydroxysteroid dehydrogenase/Delta 5--_4-isomerase-like [Huso huso]|uniref:3 beta-hydroxysteroid dehydrogenase/Delta 5-->4-isomerase-like n=1 Tax=Huso huso TaxID=61971 RepID=A0ABR0ZQA6_HUSHU
MSLAGEVCLITGAFGFLGQRIIKLLLQEDELAEIRLLDRHVRLDILESLEEFRGQTKLTVFEGDIRNAELLKKACRHVSLVIHTASLIDVIGAIDERELKEVNVKGTQFLLEACIQENVKSFIYTSSIEVAGPNTRGDPVINGNEDTVYSCSLKFPYSKTKFQAEQLVLQVNGEVLRSQDKMVTCALRPMYIYGEGSKFLLGHMDNGIRNGGILLRRSKKESVVNPVYVGNVAWAHILAAKAMRDPKKAALIGGRFYFISDDTPHVSYSDFNHVVLKPLGFGIQERLALPLPLLLFLTLLLEMVQVFLKPFVKYTPRMNRQLLILLNTPFSFTYEKAQRDFGYTPKYSWEDARTITTSWLESVLPQHRALLKTH